MTIRFGYMDRGNIEYAKRALRRKYIGDNIATGPLTAGDVYRIGSFSAGDDFTNVGAGSNESTVIFKATGTTPAVWTHGSILNRIDVATLRTDADAQFAKVEEITLTRAGFEGGSGEGQITFPAKEKGEAYEELIEELDPDWVPPIQIGSGLVMQFGI